MRWLWLLAALMATPAVADYTGWPNGAVPVSVTAAPVANTAITLTIPVTAGWTNYVYDVRCSNNGATAPTWQTVTLAGILGGTRSYLVHIRETAVAGEHVANNFAVRFEPPLPASGVGVAITLVFPAAGTGGTLSACGLTGFRARPPT